MNAVRRLALAVLLLGASPAAAQPLFRCERDWSLEISGRRYGFREVVMTPGERHWTEVWFADHKFQPAIIRTDRWVLAVPGVGPVLAVRRFLPLSPRKPRP